jgi:sec-independent protein translocase protein TatA
MSTTLLFLGNFGTGEIIALVLIVVLLFGAKRIPELARGMGKGIREFKDATKEIKHDIENSGNDNHAANRPQGGPYNPNPGAPTYNQTPGQAPQAPYNNEPGVNPNPTNTPHNPNV